MIFPHRFSFMMGTTAWAVRKAPFRLMSIIVSHSSSVYSSMTLLIIRPALLTRMSTVPNSFTTPSTKDSTSDFFETSHRMATAVPPPDAIFSATRCPSSGLP